MPHFYALYSNIIYLWDTDDFPRKRALHFTIFSLKPICTLDLMVGGRALIVSALSSGGYNHEKRGFEVSNFVTFPNSL